MAKENTNEDSVHISVELSDPYDGVTSKLRSTDSSVLVPESFRNDVRQVLNTVRTIDGGTRSRITDSLPDEMAVEYDSESLVELQRWKENA